MPCTINLNVTESAGPGFPPISPGNLKPPFKVPNVVPPLEGFPEDLVELFNKLTFILPAGLLKPPLDPSFHKSIFNAIMTLLNMLFPYLMLYKFILPVFNIIICVIEVLCAIANPFKLIRAIRKLFSQCLPAFLALFPIFALIAMMISLLALLVELVAYIIEQIIKIVKLLQKNIEVIVNAFKDQSSKSFLTAIQKVADVLCMFKNAFIMLQIFMTIFDVIKEVLKLSFSIPPCDDGNQSDTGCCTTDVCPEFLKEGNFTRSTGTFKYLNAVTVDSTSYPDYFKSLISSGLIILNSREESYQFFDDQATQNKQFVNIINAYDVTTDPKPIFYPTDATFTPTTPISQIPYLVDVTIDYNPAYYGRTGAARKIKFIDCSVFKVPTTTLSEYNGSLTSKPTGVLTLGGGKGQELDGTLLLNPTGEFATLENFITLPAQFTPLPTDGYVSTNAEYTFKPVYEVLFGRNLITLGCIPEVSIDKAVTNTLFNANISASTAALDALFNGTNGVTLFNGTNGVTFPDPGAALECLTVAIDTLTANFSNQGLVDFQTTTTACMTKLQNDAIGSLKELIKAGVDYTKSNFTLDPAIQFTTKKIFVSVDLKEGNGTSITQNLVSDVASDIASNIVPEITFGDISDFTYDGSKLFKAELSSKITGKGKIKIKFNNNYLSTFTPGNATTTTSSVSIQELDYEFIYAPDLFDDGLIIRRDEGDVARDNVGSTNE